MKYQLPSLVMFAEGNIFVKAAGTFPENDGSTETKMHLLHMIGHVCRLRRTDFKETSFLIHV